MHLSEFLRRIYGRHRAWHAGGQETDRWPKKRASHSTKDVVHLMQDFIGRSLSRVKQAKPCSKAQSLPRWMEVRVC